MVRASHDVMPDTGLYQPANADDALEIADRLGASGWLVGGGQDTYGWLKDRAKSPQAMIELTAIDAWKGVKEVDGGLEIGALTTLTEIANDRTIKEKFALLALAASRVATPQIRNVGTLAGNICQDARCLYYRRGLDCYRAGGNLCYADTPQGLNREHSLFNSSRCVAVSPSDTAPALVALNADIVIASSKGQKVVKADNFFIGPDKDITHMTILRPGEIVTAVRLPAEWANARFYFEKWADRRAWDFALVNIATAIKVENGTVQKARVVCGAVACTPYRVKNVESGLIGKPLNDQTADAMAAIAANGAQALAHNGFKIPVMENLVRRAVRGNV